MSALSLLLAVLPAVALVLTLARGHYPGELALERLRAIVRRRPGAGARTSRPRWFRRARRRSGALLAAAVAGRGPPGALAST